MLYQNLLMGQRPYVIKVETMSGFGVHRHPEIELSFCIRGSYDICIEKKEYHLQAGDLAIVGSMVSHMFPATPDTACLALTIEAGPMLLAEYFRPFAKMALEEPVIHLGEKPEHRALCQMLEECAELRQNPADFSEMIVLGNLYRIFGYVLSRFVQGQAVEMKELRDVAKVDQALEMIAARYADPLKLEEVASATGYGKSNFCRVFRQITGSTFHAVLNERRMENACHLLRSSSLSMEEIARQTGFADAKTFCRIFKKNKGVTPGTYRKTKPSF